MNKIRLAKIVTLGLMALGAVCPMFGQLHYTAIDASKGISDNCALHIFQLRDDRIAITTYGNINIYNGATFQYVHASNCDTYHLEDYLGAYHVYEDQEQRLWVKTYQQTFCFDLVQNKWVANIDSCFKKMGIEETADDLFFDHDGATWYVAGKTINLAKPSEKPKRFVIPDDTGGLLDMETADGNLYLFFDNGEIIAYDIQKGKMEYRKTYNPHNEDMVTITSMVVYNDGCFYQLRRLNGTGKCMKFDTKKQEWTVLLETSYDLHTIALTKNNTVMICSARDMWTIDLNTLEATSANTIIVDGKEQSTFDMNSVFADNQGGIWLGTMDRGLLYAHRNLFRMKSVTDISSLGEINIEKTFGRELTDQRGWIWRCSFDGVSVEKDGTETKYFSEDGLSNNSIKSLAEDRQGNIWIASCNGITKAQVKNDKISFESFFQNDGALSGDYYDTPASMLETGEILFEGHNGFTLIDPESTESQTIPLSPILSAVFVNGNQRSAYISNLDLQYNENSLELEYASLNYSQPSHTIFRYRLVKDGFDADTLWRTETASSHGGKADLQGLLHLTFSELQPGNYVLQVEATSQADVWSGNRAELTICIHQAWWKTPIAYTLYIIIILMVLAYGIYMYRQRVRQRRKEEIMMMRIQNLIQLVNQNITINDSPSEEDNEEESEDLEQEDETFSDPLIAKAIDLIEKNISSQGYSVEQLSRDLCMERTGLYKKISSVLDQSPSALIKSIRLHHAVELIKNTDRSITVIAEQTGFSSASHLGRCIQAEYGCKASELRK